MPGFKSALVLENEPADVNKAVLVLRTSGIDSIVTFNPSITAQAYLNNGIAGATVLPNLLLVDLDLEQESGYDLIRFWRTTPTLTQIPLMVWSVLGEDHEAVCDLFKVNRFIPKWNGVDDLRKAIDEVLEGSSTPV